MPVTKKLQSYLEQHGISYEVLEHDEEFTSPELAERLQVSGKQVAKVVMVKADDRMVMTVVPANQIVDLETLAAVLGAEEAVLASERAFGKLFPDCEKGAMPPFGNLYGLPTLADEQLRRQETIVFQGGTHRHAVRMRWEDWDRTVKPKYAGFAEPR